MNRRAAHQRWWSLISVIALIGQLLLPAVHAQSWARDNGDPLLYAFCGKISPAMVERLRKTLPPEVASRAQTDHAKLDKLSCSLCVSAHGGHLGTAPHIAVPQLPPLASPSISTWTAATPVVQLVVLPTLRGPPQYT